MIFYHAGVASGCIHVVDRGGPVHPTFARQCSWDRSGDYGRTLSERPCYILPMFLFIFFLAALVGQTAERIFTKLSHVVGIRCYLRTY